MTLRLVKSYIICQISYYIRIFAGKGDGAITVSEDIQTVRVNLNPDKGDNLIAGFGGLLAVLLPVEVHSISAILEIFLAAVFIIILFMRFKKDATGRGGLRRTLFVFAGLLILIPAFNADRSLISFSYAVFLIGELFSHITEFIGEGPVLELDGKKHSIPGTAVFFFLAFLVSLGIFLIVEPTFHLMSGAMFYNLSCAFIVSVIVTILKLAASNDIEYFISPLLIFVMLYSFMNMQNIPLAGSFFTAFLLAFAISYFTFRLKMITAGGAVAVFLLASIIFGYGGWKWTVPILIFFILSSLLSKLRRRIRSGRGEVGKGDTRDRVQVLANGGIAAAAVILYQLFNSELLYAVYVSSIAAVCADTWGTEIGLMINSVTVDILTFKKVVPGLSGGISIPGLLGGVLGAFIIAVSSLSWIQFNVINFLIFVTAAGLMGSVVDSILGSSLQAKYKCAKCGTVSEGRMHCGEKTGLIKGIDWISNDFVNVAASLSGGLFLLLFNIYSAGIR